MSLVSPSVRREAGSRPSSPDWMASTAGLAPVLDRRGGYVGPSKAPSGQVQRTRVAISG